MRVLLAKLMIQIAYLLNRAARRVCNHPKAYYFRYGSGREVPCCWQCGAFGYRDGVRDSHVKQRV